LIKIFSRIFGTNESSMLSDLEKGDVAETVTTFFLQSKKIFPAEKACLTVNEVDSFLDDLTKLTHEDDQVYFWKLKKCNTKWGSYVMF